MPNYRNSSQDSITANADAVTLAYRQFYNGGAGIQITGTYTGTLQFEVTIDGTNYNPIVATNVTTTATGTTTTGTGIFAFDVVGVLAIRVIATAWTSGTAVVTIAGMAG